MSRSALQAKSPSRRLVSCMSVVLILVVVPLSVFGQDDPSVAALRQMGKAFTQIAGKASSAVVGVKAVKTVEADTDSRESIEDFNEEDLFDYFFRRRQGRPYSRPRSREIAQGSGFLVTPDGYILTNNHLVGESEKVSVQLPDDRTLDARIIGVDPDSDVAVIKIEVENMPYLELADSAVLDVGEWVLAIGSPFGLSHTVTAGIVSAKGRSSIGVANYEDFIQTDAAINLGNSGGPLLNLDGKVVGINTAIIGPGGNVGIGLAIPINMAKDVYKQLKETGSVVRGFLGVMPEDVEPDMAEFFGLQEARGVLISEVTKDSAAEAAGLQRGDVVIRFDGTAVENANAFRNRVSMYKPGTEAEIVILRDGKQMTFTVKLAQRPEDETVSSDEPKSVERLGFTVQALTDELAQRLDYEGLDGVVVSDVEPGSQAEEKGIRRGALIREVNREHIRNVREFNEAVRKAQERGNVLFLVRYGGFDRYIVVQQEK